MQEPISDAARLRYPALAGIERHALACDPEECAGLLLARSFLPLRNIAADPRQGFELDPLDVARALGDGAQVVGIYHSHTKGPPLPSDRDKGCPWLAQGWQYWIVTPCSRSWSRWVWKGSEFVPG